MQVPLAEPVTRSRGSTRSPKGVPTAHFACNGRIHGPWRLHIQLQDGYGLHARRGLDRSGHHSARAVAKVQQAP